MLMCQSFDFALNRISITLYYEDTDNEDEYVDLRDRHAYYNIILGRTLCVVPAGAEIKHSYE